MTGRTIQPGKPNYLFIVLVSISLGIHFLLFLHIAGIYRSETTSYIELTVQNISKPFVRAIPRPRQRHTAPKPHESTMQPVRQHVIPRIHIDPADSLSQSPLSEIISTPDTKDLSQYQTPESGRRIFTRMDYFEMLRLRIESRKKYPETARNRHIEGRVKVRFSVNAYGIAERVEITGSSGHSMLDQAALRAVKTASPFPIPPSKLFQAPLNMEIVIVFELT